MADGKIIIETAMDNAGLEKGVSRIKNNFDGLNATLKKFGAMIGVAFGVKALVDFSKECIELGSNVSEVQNVVDTAFGDMAYKVEAFADTAIEQFGMSSLAAKKTASTYMAMAKGMGLADDTASDMAITLAGLTGDVASFYNISQEAADIKLKSVFTGESESLKELGVVMTQTNLKAYALEQGITKDISAMSQAEQVSLRYGYVMESLALANGDFAKTSDSWANQTRILSMQWQEFMSIAGQSLITILRPMVVTLNSIVSAMIDVANSVNSVVTALFGGTSAQMQQTQKDADAVGGAIEGSVENQDDLTNAVKETNEETKKSLSNFDEINKLYGEAASLNVDDSTESDIDSSLNQILVTEKEVQGVSEKMAALIESLQVGFQKLKGWVVAFFKPFKESWAEHGESVIAAAKSALSSIIGLLQSVGDAFSAAWSGWAGVAILSTIHGIVAGIADRAGTLAERFRVAWDACGNGQAIIAALLGAFDIFLSTIKRIVDATVEWAKSLDFEPLLSSLRSMLEAFAPLISIIGDTVAGIWETTVLPFLTWLIETALPFVLDKLSELFDFLADHPWVIETLTKLVTAFVAAWALSSAITMVCALVSSLSPLKILLATIAGLVIAMVSAWGNMSPLERAISVIGALTLAITTLAVAMGALNGIGGALIAAAGIAAGIAMVVSAVNSANSRASSTQRGAGRSSVSNIASTYSLASVPHLARGAVIPANREFLAVLGDQKSGTNIEAPTSEIEAAVARGIRRAGASGGGNHTVILEVDKQVLGRVTYKANQDEFRRVGVDLVEA